MNHRPFELKLRIASLLVLVLTGALIVLQPAQARPYPVAPAGVAQAPHREVTERLTPIDNATTATRLPWPDLSPATATLRSFPSATATASPAPTHSPLPSATLEASATPGRSALAMVEWGVPTPDGVQRTARVPILMYRYISDPPRGADSLRRDLSVTGADFELQLRYLAGEGYHAVHLSDLVAHLQRGMPLPNKPVVLTFDDGYKDAYTVAFPLLKKYGFTGTFFVFTKPVDEENRDYLSWRDVELMSAAGMEFGSHSYAHPDLRGRPREFLTHEIADSKTAIEAYIRQPVRLFCYPSGGFDRRVVAAVKEAGYWAAVTTQSGIDHDSGELLQITRIRVRGSDGLERFDALLNRD